MAPQSTVETHLKQPSSKTTLCGFLKVVAPISKSTQSACVYFKEQIKNLKKSSWVLGHPLLFTVSGGEESDGALSFP